MLLQVILYFYYCCFTNSSSKNKHFTLKMDSDVHDSFIIPNNHKRLYHIVPYHAELCCTVPYHVELCSTVPYHTELCSAVPYCTIPYRVELCCTVPYHAELCYTAPLTAGEYRRIVNVCRITIVPCLHTFFLIKKKHGLKLSLCLMKASHHEDMGHLRCSFKLQLFYPWQKCCSMP